MKMLANLFVAACLFFVCTSCTYMNGADPITGDPVPLFADFMRTYTKAYSGAEYNKRLANFKETIARVNNLNEESYDAVFGITKFADMSKEEFKNTVLMRNYVPKSSTKQIAAKPIKHSDVSDAPATFDWRDKNVVTPVKDQEQCGSCWAFSAAEAIESAWIIAGKGNDTTTLLSTQQIVDCDYLSKGCNGGTTESAYDYIKLVGGLDAFVDYPYYGQRGSCEFKRSEIMATIDGHEKGTTERDEQTLQTNMLSWGPLSICVEADPWQDYMGGVLNATQCGTYLDHCVQLVGYNTTASNPYWIVRNSWNTDWGMQGYIWLQMWNDTCGLTHDSTWPLVKTSSVLLDV